jgi:bifunctional DNase/RNase
VVATFSHLDRVAESAGDRSPSAVDHGPAHDLLGSAIAALGGRLRRIEIHSLREGTYFARLIVETADGVIDVDSRPSDAIALALRAQAPIWTARKVLEDAISASKATDTTDDERLREWLTNARPEDLGKYPM